jgi:hypothetical protein
MVKAKGKIKRERAEAQKALEESIGTLKIVRREPGVKQDVPSEEIRNILTDSFDRILEELAPRTFQNNRRLQAEELALRTLRLLKHGIPREPGKDEGYKIRDEEQPVPLCKDCK